MLTIKNRFKLKLQSSLAALSYVTRLQYKHLILTTGLTNHKAADLIDELNQDSLSGLHMAGLLYKEQLVMSGVCFRIFTQKKIKDKQQITPNMIKASKASHQTGTVRSSLLLCISVWMSRLVNRLPASVLTSCWQVSELLSSRVVRWCC